MKKDFLTIFDRDAGELRKLILNAIKLKEHKNAGAAQDWHLKEKNIALIFEKPSTRTRVSFEVGITELGGTPLFLSSNDIQLGRGEPIKDTARVLSRYVDGIMIRTFGHDRIIEMAKYACVPVINGLSDEYHPCQIMADIMTCYENFKTFKNLNVVYAGDGNNIAHSWMNAAARFGFQLTIASPKECSVKQSNYENALKECEKTGGKIILTDDLKKAAEGANVITTDVWASMGQEADAAKKAELLKPYQINRDIMSIAKGAIFLHCLPAHRGEEVTEDVLESSASKVFDEAENRLHIQKSIMIDVFANSTK